MTTNTARSTTKWSEIKQPETLERRARIDALKDAADAAIALADLRAARGITQATLAAELGTSQPSISQLERRDDVFLSTLREYVEGLGGRMRIVAEFDDETITFAGIGPEPGLTKGRVEVARPRHLATQ